MAMTGMTSLQERRDELKRQLVENEYIILVEVIVLRTGRLLRRITRSPKQLPFWYSALALVLVIMLIGLVLSSFLSEFNPKPILLLIEGIGLIYVGMIVFEIHHENFIANLHEHVVDAIDSERDLVDLQHWLNQTASTKAAAFFSGAIAVLGGLFVQFVYQNTAGEFIGFGPIVALVLSSVLYGAMVYYGILFFTLPSRLSRYEFKLYMPDPSSSALIQYLSRMFANALYLFAFYAALTALLNVAVDLFVSFNAVRLFGWWGIITALFVMIQYALSRIITTAKYKTLEEVEARIEQTLSKANLNENETRDAINWLMDYHDRIKSTPNSALHIRALFEFVNSLLLPLLAFLFTHLDEIAALFSK
jgi:hypothetical protein